MKTIMQGDDIKRASDVEAERLVKDYGWHYVPKGKWKSAHSRNKRQLKPVKS